MAVKNAKTNKKAGAAEKPKPKLPRVTARIDRLVDSESTKVKAIASATIADAFAIHDIRVTDSHKGLFVQMPCSSYKKDGKTEYSDIFHAITADARTELNSKVLEAYERYIAEAEEENEAEEDSEELDDLSQDDAPVQTM